MLAWAQNCPWSQAWSPLPKPTHSAQGCACLCSPRSQPTALTPHPAGYEETLTRLAAILAKHFADTRIVGTDIRDSLMQALASYVCYPHSLRAVERIPEEQ